MGVDAVQRPIERAYRSVIFDNTRWECFVPRADDIFVCTPVKCGTTWMQTIVTEMLFPDGAPGPVTEIAPWLDARFEPIDEIIERLDTQTHRRSVKTHTPADGIPWYRSARYIVVGRDGRDALMSFLNHSRNFRPELFPGLVASAIEDDIDLGDMTPPPVDDVHEFFTWSVDENPMWFEHVASFWLHHGQRNVLFVHYNDLQANLDAQMRRVASFLDVEVDERRWHGQVERCTFESMKRRSAEIGDFDAHFVGGADTFLFKGSNGRWRDVLTADELERFDRRAREFLSEDAYAWTMLGESALSSG